MSLVISNEFDEIWNYKYRPKYYIPPNRKLSRRKNYLGFENKLNPLR